jgi:hypothetical protein
MLLSQFIELLLLKKRLTYFLAELSARSCRELFAAAWWHPAGDENHQQRGEASDNFAAGFQGLQHHRLL